MVAYHFFVFIVLFYFEVILTFRFSPSFYSEWMLLTLHVFQGKQGNVSLTASDDVAHI